MQARASARHGVRGYVSGQSHTGGTESSCAGLKRGYHGTLNHMNTTHNHSHTNGIAGRRPDTLDMKGDITRGVKGGRLRGAGLIEG